jgi:hypothetical protein
MAIRLIPDGDRAAPPTTPLAKVAAFIAILAALAVGVFAMGRLADDDRSALLLTGVWFGAALLAGYLAVRRRRDLLVPLGSAFAIGSLGVTVLVGLPTLIDRTVAEAVITTEATGVTERATGSFVPLAHPGTGTATVLIGADGAATLTLTGFSTDPGPDLRVYLTAADPAGGEPIGEFVDLGALKGNIGDQQYAIPVDTDLDRFRSVVVWCRAFDVGFTSATLTAPTA